MKCTRWQSQLLGRLIYVSAAILFSALSAHAQTDVILPPMGGYVTVGGTGGAQFIARCPQGEFLTGVELWTGDDVDAIRPTCVTASGPANVRPLDNLPSKFGGGGGVARFLICPKEAPIVMGMYVSAEGKTLIVNNIHLWCGIAATTQKLSVLPNLVFDGPVYTGGGFSFRTHDTQYCPAGLVAVGINGRSGVWLDAVGLVCGVPTITPKDSGPVKEIGRVKQPVKEIGRVKLPAEARPAFIYAIASDGNLQWRRYDGNAVGGGFETWQGPRVVDRDWNKFKQVFAGDNGAIYAITQQGVLMLYSHAGFVTGLGRDDPGGWLPPQTLATGWGNFKQVFSAGDGVIYAIAPNGILKWYRHTGFANGRATWEGPKDGVGTGWTDFKQVFSGGKGIIYAITQDGKLLWYRHRAYLSGAGPETPGAWKGYKEVSTGWGDYERVFSSGEGIIYAITQDGKLMWYHHRAFEDGASAVDCSRYVGVARDICLKRGVPMWDGPKQVRGDWSYFLRVFAQL